MAYTLNRYGFQKTCNWTGRDLIRSRFVTAWSSSNATQFFSCCCTTLIRLWSKFSIHNQRLSSLCISLRWFSTLLHNYFVVVSDINRSSWDCRLQSRMCRELHKPTRLTQCKCQKREERAFCRLISKSFKVPNLTSASFKALFWTFAWTCLM